MASITQDMRYRLSLIKYAERYGVTKAAVKYKTNRQYIYRWKNREFSAYGYSYFGGTHVNVWSLGDMEGK